MKKLLLCLIALCSFGLLLYPNLVKGQTYCYPKFDISNGRSACDGDSIYYFKFGSYVRTSGCSTDGLDTSQASSSAFTIYRGKQYEIKFKSATNHKFGIWIDYNNDGDFYDPGEFVGSDNVAGLDTFYSVYTIPQTVTPVTTRMRIMTAAYATTFNDFIGDDSSCADYSSYKGEMEDYLVTIAAPANDLALIGIFRPQNYDCASSTSQIKLVVANYGNNTQTSIPLVFKEGSNTYTQTFSKTLARDQRDTFTFTSTFSASSGTLNVSAYTNLAGDDDRTNDSAKNTVLLYAIPNDPVTPGSNIDQCGNNSLYVQAKSSTSGTQTYWYTSSKLDTVKYIGDSLFMAPIQSAKTFYVRSQYYNKANIKTLYFTGTGIRNNNGNLFDIKAKSTIIIDSFYVHLTTTGSETIEVYYKLGSYKGFEKNSSAWTKIGEYAVTGKGAGVGTPFDVTDFKLEAGNTYGIYLRAKVGATVMQYDFGSNVYSNNDMDLSTGATLGALFSGSLTPTRNWNGEIVYYYDACKSSLKTITVTPKPTVTGTKVTPGSPFVGLFNQGTISDPDGICVSDTLRYDITPPNTMTNADYGSKWSITSINITSLNGTSYNRFAITNPASGVPGKIKIYPDNTWKDSTLRFVMTIKNLSGCDSNIVRIIRVSVQPTSSFTPSSTNTCEGSTISFTNNSTTGAGITYLWDFGISSSNKDTSTSPSPTFAYPDHGTYIVSLVTYSTGCKDSVTATINVSAASTGGALGKGSPYHGYYFSGKANDPDLGCVRDTLTYEIVPPTAFTSADYGTKWEIASYSLKTTGGSSTSNFKFNAPSSSGNGSFVFTPNIADADLVFVLTATYRTLNSNCKDSTLTRYISITSSPTANFTYKGICAGEPTAFTDAAIVPPGLVVRKYEFGVGTAFATTSNPTYTYTTPGEYTVTYTVTSKGGCDDIMKQKVTIYADPTADFEVPAVVCAGNPVIFANKSSGNGATITRYKWTFKESTSLPDTSAQANASHVYKTSGTHTATLEVWTDGGCNGSLTKTITVVDAPTASFSMTKACVNAPLNFVNSSTGAVSYEWRFSDQDTIRTKDAVKTFKFQSSYSVTLVATSASGCRDSVTKQIEFHDQPKVDFNTIGSCAGQLVSFKDATDFGSGSSSGFEWTWTIDGKTLTGTNTSYTFAAAGNYNVKLRVKTNNGCVDSVIKAVTIDPAPTAGMTLPQSACVNVAAAFENTSSGTGLSYLWDFGDSATSQDENPRHTYTKTGTFQVKLITTNGKGCKDSVTKSLIVGLGPEVPFVWCVENKKVFFTASNTSYATYEWDFDDILGGTGTGATTSYTYIATDGEYDVTLTVTDANGCVGTHTAKVGTGKHDNSTVKDCKTSIEGMTARKLNMNIYPNPFSHKTMIEYELLKSQQVRVSVWDATGKQVAVLSDGMQQPGVQQIMLDANEHKQSAGLYMIRIETEGAVAAFQVLRLE